MKSQFFYPRTMPSGGQGLELDQCIDEFLEWGYKFYNPTRWRLSISSHNLISYINSIQITCKTRIFISQVQMINSWIRSVALRMSSIRQNT